MRLCRIAKTAAFLLLVIAFVLPLSRCSTEGESGAEPGGYEYYWAWSHFKADSVDSWLIILAFFWPVPFIYHASIPRARESRIWMLAAEVLLCVGSAYMIWADTFLNKLWVGGWLAYGALCIYLGFTILELIAVVRNRIRKKRRVTT